MRFRFMCILLLAIVLLAGGSPAAAQAAPSDPPRDLVRSAPLSVEEATYEAFVRSVEAGSAQQLRTRVLPPMSSEAMVAGSFFCLPTCPADDGRFLALAPNGPGLETLSDDDLDFELAVDASTTSFVLGFFDADTGGTHWDLGSGVLEMTLYADPLADGTGTQVVATFDGSTMPNNAWVDFVVTTGPEAQAPSGNYFYRLNVNLTTPSSNAISSFKIRSSEMATIQVFQQPIGFIAQIVSLADAQTIYPAFPSLTPTTYDGTFPFFLDVPAPQTDLIIWDGDLDRGSFDQTDLDTDDPNTPNDVQPPWAVDNPGAKLEGVAVGLGGLAGVGSPPDDRSPAGLGVFLLKPPSIHYYVIGPEGQVFVNDNPSGNGEWERFQITTEPFDPAEHDFTAPSLPPGPYEVLIDGLDMQNLNAFYFFRPVLCVDENQLPCGPVPRPFLVGDTVFFDTDGDGIQGPGEPGIAGVIVRLLTDNGELIAETTTDADGFYSFEVTGPRIVEGIVVDSGVYTMQLAAENFAMGGALEGTVVTTPGANGGTEQTDSVIDDNVLTYDFGVRGTSAIGDRVWKDRDGDGLQEPGEPGIEGVTVRLLDEDGTLIATTVTGADGEYLFEGLVGGTYTVEIDTSTLPAGLEPTFDSDGLATPHRTTIFLPPQTETLTVDFGYDGCGECEGKVTRLVLRYDGALPAQVEVVAKRGPSTDLVFSGTLQPGESFEVVGPQSGNGGFFGTLGTEIRLFVDGDLNTELHTSCSQPIGPGTVGGDFAVLAGASRHGGPLCPAGGDTGGNDGGCKRKDDRGGRHGGGRYEDSRRGGGHHGGGHDGGDRECDDEEDDEGSPGTGTIGYWKNHPGAWPVSTLRLGGSRASKQEALEILHTSPRGDESIILLHQLIAAKLNVAAGNEDHCIDDTIEDADEWLEDHGSDALPSYRVAVDYGRKGHGDRRGGGRHGHDPDEEAEELAERLDDYNNGRLCAPHRG